jgi:DNA anti-recombination protein RmuC
LEAAEKHWKQLNADHETELNQIHHNELEKLKAQLQAELNAKNEEIEHLGMDLLQRADELAKVRECSLMLAF